MYGEIPLLDLIPNRKTQVGMALLFIEEYGGWLTHLENIGTAWGSDISSDKVAESVATTKEHLSKLRSFVEVRCNGCRTVANRNHACKQTPEVSR